MKPSPRMSPVLWNLLGEYCKDNGIDIQECDKSLSYWENMDLLAKRFGTLKTPTIYQRIRRGLRK
jgi:hypothetical protein